MLVELLMDFVAMLRLVVELELVDKFNLGVNVVGDIVVTVAVFVEDVIGSFSCIKDESSMISIGKIKDIFKPGS